MTLSTNNNRSIFGSVKVVMSASADIMVATAEGGSQFVKNVCGTVNDQLAVTRATNRLEDVKGFVVSKLQALNELREVVSTVSSEEAVDVERAIQQLRAIELVY